MQQFVTTIHGPILFAALLLFGAFPCGGASAVQAPAKDCVILLHGLGRSYRSMKKIASFLSEKGYQTFNIDYPSTSETIESIVEKQVAAAVSRCKEEGCGAIHFVTHSMGGIALRAYLQDHTLPEGSRVVMLAPPNQGSEVVDHLKDNALFQWFLGPAAQTLGTDPHSIPNQLGPVRIPVGVIAGNKSSDPWFAGIMEGANDGKVSVRRAKLKEMTDFLVLPVGHTFIMNDDEVMRQTAFFIANGHFDPDVSLQ